MDKLGVAEEFGSVLLGHFGNLEGTNDFEHCSVGFLIGRNEWPWHMTEAAARAWNFDSRRELRFIAPNTKGKKFLARRSAVYHVKPGVTVPKEAERQKVSYHLDQAVQRRLEAPRENELFQALDRARLIWNPVRKHIYILCDIPCRG
jgi:hypothetical protein